MTQFTTLNGTAISRLTFGTMQFGGKADATESRAMFDAAIAAGITHFDTAIGYNDGASETLLGDFIKDTRDDIFVASKVAYVGGSARVNLTRHLDRHRKQLRADTVDLMYLHRFDDNTPLEETFSTLAEWQSTGLIRYIGVSNFAAWQVMKAQAVAQALGTRIDAIQPMYSLVKRQAEVEIIPMATDQDISIIPYSPLGGGLLTGKYARGETGRLTHDARYAQRYDVQWMRDCAAALSRLAADWDTNPATLAVAWVAAHAAGISPIISASSAAQLAPSLGAADMALTPAQYAAITALSQTPAPATDRLDEA